MPQVQLIIDIDEHHNEPRRAERTTTLPGVPREGDAVVVARHLALRVWSVVWEAEHGSVLVFLTKGDNGPSSITTGPDDLGVLKMPESYVDSLRDAGWTVEDPAN